MENKSFKKNHLAATISTVLGPIVFGAMPIFPAVAQSDNYGDLEEVVVTGIRASLERSMDIKRDATGVVDAISAEEIGKMPDTNLAESLQRITGVSIDRQNGEGSRVTVRGFGPDYNVVTLNGRQMPAANIEGTTASAARSFDFANLAAESVRAVEIYKSGKASLSTGGIGSVINIKTARPLDTPDLIANIGVKAMHDTSNESGSDWTPEVSGIFSRTFAEDTIGVALTASYSERDSGFNQAETPGGWYTIPAGQGDWGSVAPDNPDFVNAPQEGDIYAVPRNIGYAFNQIQRERTNAQLTFQWAPMQTIEATLDYTYSEQDVEQRFHSLGAWFNGVPQSGEFTPGTGNGSVVAPVIYTDGTGADITMSAGDWGTVNENNSIGLNVEWAATDRLTLVFDYHNSDAENGAKDDRGSNNVVTGVQFNRGATTVDYSRELPVVTFQYIDGLGLTPSEFLTSGTSFRNSFMKHDIEQTKIDGVFSFDTGVVKSIDFGLAMLDSENRSAFANAQRDTWGGYGVPEDYDDSLFVRRNLGSKFDRLSGSSNPALEPYYYEASFDGMLDAIAAVATANGEDISSCGVRLCASSDFTTDRTALEEQRAAYAQVNLAWEQWAMPMQLTVGLRYEDTDVTSKALVPIYDSIAWVADNEFRAQSTRTGFTQLTGGYNNWLPNIDFDIEFTEDIVGRISASKTMTRPLYNHIQGGETINELVRFNGGTGNRGNPDLDPFESTNLDLSGEWYYAQGSYLSVGFYAKRVKNFIGETSVEETTFDLAHPAQGPRWEQAVADLGTDDPEQVRAYMEGLYGAPVVGDAALGDRSAVFRLITPVNATTAEIDGFEVALQHMFGDSGFGAIVNFTTVDGDIEYDNFDTNKGEGVGNQIPLVGLSDSYNLVAFYDKHGIQVRIAYNWRDDFLNATIDGNGERNPVYTEDYGQWDVNASYQIDDKLSVFVEGINVTDETRRLYGRHENMVIAAIQSGARFNLGVRYNF
ncbi:TonB-dependent receptor [Exilibacterium tricleocarpae]|uniref:TonB-dependent receptor n=1 Tax=Exilibacterium tricleocarpae TaxID=2591008 RepID=A0A545SLW2_9GAMM|nr:TonB-dependent receptor [Exilibacterium tricleocarpae]TQV65965.1 TonB-dependent receptor [Exilibacterium tricleocarpae]